MAIAAAADSTAEQAPNTTPDHPAGNSGEASRRPDCGEANADGDDEEYEEVDEEGEEELEGPAALAAEKEKIDAVLRRLSSAPVAIRVHDIIIKGNSKTRDALIEAEVTDLIRSAATVQDLVRAPGLATGRLRNLDVLDSVHITLDAGPPELPGTTTVVVEVVEAANPISRSVGCLSKADLFRDAGIYGHAFLTTGNVAKLSESEFRNFSFAEFGHTFRSSVGVGIILPTKLSQLEVNYCHILKKCEHDHGKSGIQFSFSLPL